MDYTAFWNGCQTANERKVKSMRSIEEIVRTILNSDALMEKVNHVVEIEIYRLSFETAANQNS
jgi:hypothetical protein